MPIVPLERSHRCKRVYVVVPNALTVRLMNKKECHAGPAAKASIDKEWRRFVDRKVWGQSIVREWSDVVAEARRACDEVHMGMLCSFVVEKNRERVRGCLVRWCFGM